MIGLFSQIRTGGDIVRGRAIKFLLVKIKTEGTDLLNKETENHLLEEIKLCMGEVRRIYQCIWWSTAIFVIKPFFENSKMSTIDKSTYLCHTSIPIFSCKHIRQTFQDCTAEEFHTFMSILGMTTLPKTVTGQLKIVEMISKVNQCCA